MDLLGNTYKIVNNVEIVVDDVAAAHYILCINQYLTTVRVGQTRRAA